MPNTKFKFVDKDIKDGEKTSRRRVVAKSQFDSFDEKLLGLGDLSKDGTYVQAIATIFDLEGFTAFCNQPESHLVIPEFLKRFLNWLFRSFAKELTHKVYGDDVELYSPLPFYTKFLGDGLLFLWNVGNLDNVRQNNIVIIANKIVVAYVKEFRPSICQHVSNAPSALRCGIAKGQIVAVGNGEDYVGSCINVAARLQKLSRLTFAVSRRGLDFSGFEPQNSFWKSLLIKKVELTGIGKDELVYVVQKQFSHLAPSEKALFKKP
jgi:class 3 adenylate cyclase